MSWLENFLISGHTFDKFEYDLKSKYILLNTVISIILIMVSILTILLFLNGKLLFVLLNSVFISVSLLFVWLLRYKKNSYFFVIYAFPITSIVSVVLLMINSPTEIIRFMWFFVIIIFSFFLGGKKVGYPITLLVIITVGILNFFIDTGLSIYEMILLVAIIFLGAVVSSLYDKREVRSKQILHQMNLTLEQRVKEEINKRLLAYEKSNVELIKSAQEIKKQKDAYKELAYYDKLTGLPNRVLLFDRLKHSIAKCNRNNNRLAVIFLDLDNFKEINDSLGHFMGDKVLVEVAKRLEKKIRKSDTLTRFGGDEFIILLEDLIDISSLGEIAQNLIQAVSKPVFIQEHELFITISIGISIYPDDGRDTDSLLKCADAAMYSAKKDGFNLVHFYKKEMTQKSLDRLTLENSIRQALDKDEFVVYYQPVIDTRINRQVGLEALVRWQHPEKGLLTPCYFIDASESSALIIQLGEQVLRKVSKQLVLWHIKGFDPEFIAVNLSVKQLRHNTLIPVLLEVLKETNFRSNWLELEITESYTMYKPTEAIRLLKKIRKLGIRLSLDDFGTGYSSLSYLKNLPVNKLKIDKSFIAGIPDDTENNALVSAIVTMTKSMNLEVVAEGVETEEQKDFLRKIKCNKMQGYYFAKPMPAEELEISLNIKS